MRPEKRLTRSSAAAAKGGEGVSSSSTSKTSPTKSSPSPKKALKGRARTSKHQPRIDEPLPTGKRGRRANKEVEKNFDLEEVEVVQSSTFTITSAETQKGTDNSSQSSSASSNSWDFASQGSSSSSPSKSFGTPGSSSSSPVKSIGSPGSYSVSDVKPRPLTKDEEELEVLRSFDIDGAYGSCRGMSRRERYERALRFQLKPSPSPMILTILDQHKDDPNYSLDWETCIWDHSDMRSRLNLLNR